MYRPYPRSGSNPPSRARAWLRRWALLLVLLLIPSLVVSADEIVQLGKTELVSIGYPHQPDKDYGLGYNGNSTYSSVSWYGEGEAGVKSRIAFASAAQNLIDGQPDIDPSCRSEDPNVLRNCFDIYIQDPLLPKIPIPLLTSLHAEREGDSVFPTVSRDGKWVVFQSSSDGWLDDNPETIETDIYLVDISDLNNVTNLQTPYRVSMAAGVNQEADFHSGFVRCKYLNASGQVAQDSSTIDWDRAPVCETNPNGTARPDLQYGHPVADVYTDSGNLTYVVFESMATNLGGNNNGYLKNIYRRQVGDEQSYLLTVGCHKEGATIVYGDPANGESYHPVVVANTNGRYIVFVSRATNLDCTLPTGSVFPSDNQNDPPHMRRANIFLHDQEEGKTYLISKDPAGYPANRASEYPAVAEYSPSYGFRIAYQSSANNIDPDDLNNYTDIFLYQGTPLTTDSIDEQTRLMSVPSAELGDISGNVEPADMPSYAPAITRNGLVISFTSYATNLIDGDTNEQCNYNIEGQTTTNCPDIFARSWLAYQTWRVSLTTRGQQAEHNSNYSSLSATGRYVAFASQADMLEEGQGAPNLQVYLRDQGNPPGNPNVQPTSYNFGVVPNGETRTKTFTVRFLAELDVEIIQLQEQALGNNYTPYYAIENQGCIATWVQDQYCQFTVRFNAPASGEFRSLPVKIYMQVFSSDDGRRYLELDLDAATPVVDGEVSQPEAADLYYLGPPVGREVVVKNTGNVVTSFSIDVVSPNPDDPTEFAFSFTSEDKEKLINMKPGDEATLTLWAQSTNPLYADFEDSDSSVRITSGARTFNSLEFFTKSMVVTYQPKIEDAAPAAQTIPFSATVYYTVTVRNNGNIGDTLNVSFANNEFAMWVNQSDKDLLVNLQPGVEKTIKVWVRATTPRHLDHDAKVVITSQGDPTKKDDWLLLSTSGDAFIYLPFVRR